MDPTTPPISETLSSMKHQLSMLDYRRFLSAVHRTAWHLVKSNGQSVLYNNVDTTCDLFVEIMSQTDLAKKLVLLLGFEQTSESEGILYMRDYNRHLPSLRRLCDLAEPELLVTKGDPAADQPPPDATNVIHVVAYLSYHLYIRLLLVLRCTSSPLLYTIEDKIIRSFDLAEEATSKLGVMQPGFGLREVWYDSRQTVLRYVNTLDGEDEENNPESIGKSMSETIQMINEEVETKFPSQVHSVMSYLQNMQALMKFTYDAVPIPYHAFPIYRRNEGRFPKQCLRNEYVASMDGVRALMDIACERGLISDEREQLFGKFVWQTENFLSHIKGEMPLEVQELETRPVDEDARIAMMKETMASLKHAVGSMKYRGFLRVISLAASRAVNSEGDEDSIHINTSERTFAAVSGITRHALRLMWVLGYEDCPGCRLPGLRLSDLGQHIPTLRAFLTAAAESMGVIQGDPARHKSVEEIGTKAALVAHLAYQYRLRCCLLTVGTLQQLLGSVEPEIRASMAAVDAIAKKLRVARPDSLSGSVWETIKKDVSTYLLVGDTGSNRGSILGSFENMDGLFVGDLISAGCPPAAVHLIAFSQNIALIIIVTSNGQMLVREHAQTFMASSSKISPSAFSPQFMAELRKLRELTQKSIAQPLSDEDISRVNELSIWHVNNFLTHLRPAGLEGGFERPHLASMAGEMGLDLSAIWTAFQAGISPEDMAMDATTRQTDFKPPQLSAESRQKDDQIDKSDGDEKSDKSEKVESEDDRGLKNSAAKVTSLEEIPQETTESAVGQLLTAVKMSGGSLDDVRRVCGGLKSMAARVSAESELESLSQTLKSSRNELEHELTQLRGFCVDQQPDIVIQTITNTIIKKQQEMDDVKSRLLRAANALELVRKPLFRPRQLKDFNDVEISSLLSKIVATAQLQPGDISMLLQPIAGLLRKFQVWDVEN